MKKIRLTKLKKWKNNIFPLLEKVVILALNKLLGDMIMKKVLSLLLVGLLCVGCSSQSKPKHLNDLVAYFKEKGFSVGAKQEKTYQMIGAINGYGIELDGEQVELYEFDPKQSNATLDQVKKDGTFANNDAAVNGNFMIVEYFGPGEAKVDKAFKEFK